MINYSEPEELLADESFLVWAGTKTEAGVQTNADWDQWLATDPGRQQLVDAAIALLHATILGEMPIPFTQLDRAEKRLLNNLPKQSGKELSNKEQPGKSRTIYFRWGWIAAASILAIAAGLFMLRSQKPADAQLATAYGQIAQQTLPDGTEVTLNANSRLHFAPSWSEGADREVWIEGEAFFHVRRTPEKSRFIVHTDHFNIIVTGTRFNVVNRPGRTNVLLREGSVILQQQNDQDLSMVPGDFVEWGRDRSQLKKRTVTADSLIAWKEQKLVLERTPLRDLVGIIKDQYGVNVYLEGIADSTVSGILPNGNLDVLLQALEATSDFDVRKEDSGVKIRAHSK